MSDKPNLQDHFKALRLTKNLEESKKGSQKSKNGKSKETKAKVTRTFASVQEDKVERYGILSLNRVLTPLSSHRQNLRSQKDHDSLGSPQKAYHPLQKLNHSARAEEIRSLSTFASQSLRSPQTPNSRPLRGHSDAPNSDISMKSATAVPYLVKSNSITTPIDMHMSSPKTPGTADKEGVKKVANNTPGSPMDISPANQSPTTKHKKSRFGPDEISSKVILPRGCAKVQESASDQDGDSGTSTEISTNIQIFDSPNEAQKRQSLPAVQAQIPKRKSFPRDQVPQNCISQACREFLDEQNRLSQPSFWMDASPGSLWSVKGASPMTFDREGEGCGQAPQDFGGDTAQPAMATLDVTAAGHGKSAYGPECWRLQTRMSPKRGLRDVGSPVSEIKQRWANKIAQQNRAPKMSMNRAGDEMGSTSGHARIEDQERRSNPVDRFVRFQAGQRSEQQAKGRRQAEGKTMLKLADTNRVYKPFAKQQDAIDYAAQYNYALAQSKLDSSSQAGLVKVWCEEQKGMVKGQPVYYRSFLAATYDTFWRSYQRLAAHARHCYEVIQQDHPCNLYLDLEFMKACNLEVDGDAMVEALITSLDAEIRRVWDGVAFERKDVVELCSDTPEKFSRHLIINIPSYAFENNTTVGSFINRVMARPEAAKFTVRKRKPEADVEEFTSMVDTAVYTKNRHFRVIWSSKGGKRAILEASNRFCPMLSKPLRSQFLQSLVCNIDSKSQLLSLDLTKLNAKGLIKAAGLGRCSIKDSLGDGSVTIFHKFDEEDIEAEAMISKEEVQNLAEAAKDFVERIARERAGGSEAVVRTIAQCGMSALFAYSMLGPGSHFCENIGRPHKSNHIFFVLNFKEGVYCQKCHDQDCHGYRSEWMPLPPQLCLKKD